jgi:hypothetical protein
MNHLHLLYLASQSCSGQLHDIPHKIDLLLQQILEVDSASGTENVLRRLDDLADEFKVRHGSINLYLRT